MAKGEKVFNPNERKVTRFKFEPVENKDWEATLVSKKISIAKGQDPQKPVPYIKGVQLRLSGSAAQEGQKDRYIFHKFFLGSTPKKAGGTANIDMAGGFTEFCKALGRTPQGMRFEDYTSPDGAVTLEGLNATDVKKFLEENDGATLNLRTKTEPSFFNKTELESVVDYFIEAEQQADDDEDADDADLDEDEDEEDGDEDSEDESTPPPPVKKGKKGK